MERDRGEQTDGNR
jgi:hypothetical protein